MGLLFRYVKKAGSPGRTKGNGETLGIGGIREQCESVSVCACVSSWKTIKVGHNRVSSCHFRGTISVVLYCWHCSEGVLSTNASMGCAERAIIMQHLNPIRFARMFPVVASLKPLR